MTRAEFAAALSRYGADLATWPRPARAAALALLRRSAPARAALARALAAEAAESGAVDLALAERLLSPIRASIPSTLPERRAAPRSLLRPPVFGWSAVAAAVALGLWLGAGLGAAVSGPSPDLFAAAQLGPLGTDQP